MTEKKTRVSLKGMSEEEKKERKRTLHREYMAKRRQEDPDFAKKQRELCNNRKKVLRQDTTYVEKEREYFKLYQRNMKEDYDKLKKKYDRNDDWIGPIEEKGFLTPNGWINFCECCGKLEHWNRPGIECQLDLDYYK